MKKAPLRTAATVLTLVAFFPSCTRETGTPAAPLAVKGKSVYLANCIACHNPDPTKDGAIGPAIAGSALDLVRARVMEASYPPGYKPKRASKAMSALPQLKDQIEALHAFLNAPGT